MINIEKLSNLRIRLNEIIQEIIKINEGLEDILENLPNVTKDFLATNLRDYEYRDLSHSVVNALGRHGIEYGRELATFSSKQIKNVPGIGKKAYKQIEELLMRSGIILGE